MGCQYCHRPDCDEPTGEPCATRVLERGQHPLIAMLRGQAAAVLATPDVDEAARQHLAQTSKKRD